MDLDRHQARQRHLHQHDGERLADGEPPDARHDRRQHHLRCVVSHDRRLCGDQQLLHSAVTNGAADGAVVSASAGGNGVYAYGGTSTAGIFPTNTFNASNYWADVVFRPQLGLGDQHALRASVK